MNIWVRSQDKEDLLEAKGKIAIKVRDVDEEYIIWIDDEWAGIYKTKERALEVLNEIQDFINEIHRDIMITNMAPMNGFGHTNFECVYEMPQE